MLCLPTWCSIIPTHTYIEHLIIIPNCYFIKLFIKFIVSKEGLQSKFHLFVVRIIYYQCVRTFSCACLLYVGFFILLKIVQLFVLISPTRGLKWILTTNRSLIVTLTISQDCEVSYLDTSAPTTLVFTAALM